MQSSVPFVLILLLAITCHSGWCEQQWQDWQVSKRIVVGNQTNYYLYEEPTTWFGAYIRCQLKALDVKYTILMEMCLTSSMPSLNSVKLIILLSLLADIDSVWLGFTQFSGKTSYYKSINSGLAFRTIDDEMFSVDRRPMVSYLDLNRARRILKSNVLFSEKRSILCV